jgi:hypothetical protein
MSRAATVSRSSAPGDWQGVSIRFRAPRMDAGFNKIANALMLEVASATTCAAMSYSTSRAKARAGTRRISEAPS